MSKDPRRSERGLRRGPGSGPRVSGDIFRLLVASIRDYAIFALDATGHIMTWNPGAERFKGWAAHEIIGKHFSTFYPPEDIASGRPENHLRIAARDGAVEHEGWRVRKDGTQFWADVVITALRDPAGNVVGSAKVTRDLTERRGEEEQLRQSEERFRLIVQSVKDYAIFMLDPSGRVSSWNEGAARIKGYSPSDIIGQHFSIFYPDEDVRSGKPAMELRVATAEGRFEDEGWRVRNDGSQFWANVVITALRNAAGELIGFAKVTRDLTERRMAQQRALADARRVAEIEAASRAKTQFLTTLSHELRTPLNAIGGYADLLALEVRGPLNEAQKQDLERIRQSQQHLMALINDLLNLGRIEAGRLEYRLEPVPLFPLAQRITPMIEPQAMSRGLSFDVVGCGDEFVALADTAKVEQIMLNLLSNAVKFTPVGGRISMVCSASGDHVGISVLDTGPGIPQDKIEAIFQPFVQLGRSLTSSHEGTGLGLSISRQLARAMGGDLRVFSPPGEGSTFTLTLPRAPRAS